MPTDNPDVATISRTARSRVSNGSELFLAAADGRGREARRYRDVYHGLLSHLGGDDVVSEVRRHLAKRAAALIVWCEVCESELADGGNGGDRFDIGLYTTGVNSLRRILNDLGLDPSLRDVTPPSFHNVFDADPVEDTSKCREPRRRAPQAVGKGT